MSQAENKTSYQQVWIHSWPNQLWLLE